MDGTKRKPISSNKKMKCNQLPSIFWIFLIGLWITFWFIFFNSSSTNTVLKLLIPEPRVSSVDDIESCTKHNSRNIFIDVGANRGDTILLFLGEDLSEYFENNHSANNPHVNSNNSAYSKDEEWYIYGIEANPYHDKSLHNIQKRLTNNNNKLHMTLFLSTAAWITDGDTLTFHQDLAVTKGYWGTSIYKGWTNKASDTTFNVTTMDFSQWIKRTVSKCDNVVVKINIEGAEFEVIRKMLIDGTLCLIDEAYIYFHYGTGNRPKKLPDKFPKTIWWIAQSSDCNIKWNVFSEH
eukprot:332292_1